MSIFSWYESASNTIAIFADVLFIYLLLPPHILTHAKSAMMLRLFQIEKINKYIYEIDTNEIDKIDRDREKFLL